jgi:aerobic-type carbon monoxide dehydrogenase small subunit (CoxS/CutS family)
MTISLVINGTRKTLAIEPGEKLLDLLRREGYVGVKTGCGTGDCGACAVLLNGRAVNSCLVFAAKADGGEVVTIEGLERDGRLHPVQEAFLDEGAIQCGYCTPGMVISTVDLLSRNPDPTENEIRQGLSGNLCRCTGYVKQIRAVQRAAAAMRGGEIDA